MSEEEFGWQKACEAENNFEKAVEMVTSIFFPKSEEDWKFVNKWLFFHPSKENESRTNINLRLHP